ncbi:Inositol phoshorylceramide synthase regulatory subunit kei1 [Lecanosticta acicola]|uniref:Inositol phoshorylceramide synthase regulatory subunit kei1 n=1 Tax=Lecanosticta acicola TaxID=111012 RepID=A0AAI9E8J2_9PEZI|nr:Inositol phoshorylceramide synthase regulatory subunit kei1 [Lecanosticta acicola]
MAPALRFPKPRSLLHFVSLRTATEFINFTLLINKVTGFYGILALFTGYHLNPLQLSHYIYSLVILGLIAWLAPSIRRPDHPLKNVALAWIYVLDTIINSIYTALFGMGWFMLLSHHLQEPGKDSPIGGGAATMAEVAGFTNPENNVSQVDVVASPAPGLAPGQEAVAYGHPQSGGLGGAVLQSDSMTSIALLALLSLVRIYFCIIVMSYARSILRQYIASTSYNAPSTENPFPSTTEPTDPSMAEHPFSVRREEGAGWQGKLGRIMLRFPTKKYWLGREEQDTAQSEWERATSGRFESAGRKALKIRVPGNGVGERERRARSGTGPPPPVAPSSGKKIPE